MKYAQQMSRLAFLVALAATATVAAPSGGTNGLATLRELKVDAGRIARVEYADSPTMAIPKGRTFDNLPPRTIVKIVLNPAARSTINVEVWLPDAAKWNGRFIGLGNGGAAGSINPGTLAGVFYSGYAVATTDMGTAPDSSSGIGNPEVWKDFGFRATHLMTVAAKQVVKAHYGREPEYSYFSGGSTGGQQALQEAQRCPGDYDGIVANIPAHCRTPLHAYFLWNDQILRKCPFSESQQNAIILAGNAYMAAREIPQTAGKLVSDPRGDKNDIEAVITLARQRDPTLSDAHAEALRKLFDGPRHALTGERIFGGIPFGSSFNIAHGHLYLFKWVFGAEKDLMEIDFGKDIDAYTAALGPYLNAENADLSPFEKRGGKMIMVSGSADSCVPYHASLDYYERVAEHFGSIEKARAFLRFYIIPGMSHGPGPGINKLPNMLELVVNWREKGIVPEMIQGQRVVDGKTELDVPLYPYPTKTSWTPETGFKPVDGPRGGVDRIAERFRPAAAEATARSDVQVATRVVDGPFGDCVQISNGTAELVVCPAIGRIVRYGWQGGTNVLWTNADAAACAAKIGSWTNWGGDKAWIWPQDDWKQVTGRGWPPPSAADPGPYSCEVRSNGVVLVSPPVAGYGVRIVRTFELASTGTQVRCATRLQPVPQAAATDRAMAAWTVAQVPGAGGRWYARVEDPLAAWRTLGGGKGILPPVRIGDTRIVRLPRDTVEWTKSGTVGDLLATRRGDTLFILQQVGVDPSARPAPGDGLQVCMTPDKAPNVPEVAGPYLELEITAPLAPRAEVERHPLQFIWSLVRLAPEADDAAVARVLGDQAGVATAKGDAR